jgi:hypothetical protein
MDIDIEAFTVFVNELYKQSRSLTEEESDLIRNMILSKSTVGAIEF